VGPARIGFLLGIHPSTVHRVLSRFGLARLSWLDRATGRVIRRYEHPHPGDLVHVDIKKLGRIPDGGGHRSRGRAAGKRNKTGTAVNRRPGYAFLHNAVDDHSRLAYSEILADEKKETAAGFWERANAFFESCGITVKRVLTDNGSCYRSYAFKDALGPDIKHKRTRPYRPQTNGKVERYNRTMLDEWAYAKPYASEAERVAAFTEWLHHYNHHRGHTSLKGQPPVTRVTNLSGQYSPLRIERSGQKCEHFVDIRLGIERLQALQGLVTGSPTIVAASLLVTLTVVASTSRNSTWTAADS
jgi:transposase InsO family protein